MLHQPDPNRPVLPIEFDPLKGAFKMVAFVLSVSFSISLLLFVVLHSYLISRNATTIELHMYSKENPSPYNLGKRRNWENVFGSVVWKWFLPVQSEGLESDGVYFPKRANLLNERV
jgi:hypothetical protein